MPTRISTSALRHTCTCGRLLGIQINQRLILKHRGARDIAGGGARVVCARCKRLTTFTAFEITWP